MKTVKASMVLSCRHCYSPEEMVCSEGRVSTDASSTTAPSRNSPSYMGLFVYGGNNELHSIMECIEAVNPPIPGVTVW